jgi:hygromycin-B 4-O-kinase
VSVRLPDVERFLATRFGDDYGDVAPLRGGAWSTAFAFRRGNENCVIRFGAHREDFVKDRLAARYAGPALPIPRIIEIGESFGGHYAISERVFGEFIDEVDGVRMQALLPSLFAMLDALRLADVSETTGFGGWSVGGTALHPSWRSALLDVANDLPGLRIHGWRTDLENSPTGAEPFDGAYERLVTLADHVPETRCLIHSDMLHFNVLVDAERISGVLDWGCAKYGDFLYDLAWFCFWQPWYPAWRRIDFRAEALGHYASIGLDVPRFEERLCCYMIHIGLDAQAYQAYAGEWDKLEESARRTLDIAVS